MRVLGAGSVGDDRWVNDLLLHIADLRGGYAFRSDFLDHGVNDREIRAAVHAGLLVRLRHGTYACSVSVGGLSPEDKHRLLARSVLDRLGPDYVLSHHSAALFTAAATFDVDLGVVHVTRLTKRNSRSESGVTFHVNSIADDDVTEIDGVRMTRPVRAAYESASISGTESGLVVVNSILNAGVCTAEEYAEFAARHDDWPGSRTARLVARLADAGCESPGESRSMFMFWREGLPRPQTQLTVRAADGALIGRSDFGWLDHAHVGEFDGLFKYGRLNNRVEPGQILVDEKIREDRIRATGLGMSRWTWADLSPRRRSTTAARIMADLQRSQRTHIPLAQRRHSA